MQVTRQFLEVPASALSDQVGSEAARDAHCQVESVPTACPARRASTSGGSSPKYKIINTTINGPPYVPTTAQILAAEMAEEFYGTQVTFVHADCTTFKDIVQKLTGNSTGDSNNERAQAAAVPGTRTVNPKIDCAQAAPVRLTLSLGSGRGSIKKQGACLSPTSYVHKTKPKLNSGLPRRGPFKLQVERSNINAKAVAMELHLLHGPLQFEGGKNSTSSAMILSPVSPLRTCTEFEHSSSGDGGQGSADSQSYERRDSHARYSDEEENQGDANSHDSFTFPFLYKDTVVSNHPLLLPLFPEAPV